ncbi:amidase [Streptomyces sp. PRKS01-29]|nr:amidase family protein [Streptomyces sabulosicollis]MBI0298850.1 amidase [Streptomyces sabulosicollis]
MKLSEYVAFDAVGLAELVSRGEISPGELASTALRAVEAVNPAINATVETWEPERDVPPGEPLPGTPSLGGVPFLIKDIGVAMAGKGMELGSRLTQGLVSPADSFLMRRFKQAGLVTLGRTTTPEMAASVTTESVQYGATRNPWRLDRSAGGSSGGSAAAVAAGIVPLAHATDAAGSIRLPASYNGLFGLKPSRGRMSLGPDFDEVFNGLAVQGGLSRSVRDSAALLDCISGAEPGDPYRIAAPERPYSTEVTRAPGTLRIGVLTHAWGGRRTVSTVNDALARTVQLCDELGHQTEEVTFDLGVSWEEFVLANACIWNANLAAQIDALAALLGRPIDSTTLEPWMLACYAYGRRVSGVDLVGALAVRNRVARSLGAFFRSHDLLLTPTVPEPPVPLGTYDEDVEELDGLGWLERLLGRSPFTAPFNVAGTPAMSVPLETDAATGLPLGMQFAAEYGREDTLFRLAGQLEQARPWAGRTPAIWAGDFEG